MPWLNSGLVDIMLRACVQRDFKITSEWWRDESALETWWRGAGFNMTPKAVLCPVPCGDGFVAWIRIAHADTEVGIVWTVIAFAPDEGKPCAPDKVIFGEAKRLPESYVTQWSARDVLKIPHNVAQSGNRVACTDYSGFGRIAKCSQVDERGAVTEIETLDGDMKPAASIGKRWFKVEDRDEAFDHFWNEKKDTWQSYKGMAGALWHAQNRLAKKGTAPAPPKHEKRRPHQWQANAAPIKPAAPVIVAEPKMEPADVAHVRKNGGLAYHDGAAYEFVQEPLFSAEFVAVWQAGWNEAALNDAI